MTMYEHFKYINVESNYKEPILPIWIIQKEYHYSCMFAKDSRANNFENTEKFDVIYYDGLYNFEDRIILTVTKKEKKEEMTLFRNRNKEE